MTEIREREVEGFGAGAVELVGLHDGVEAGREVMLPFEIRAKGKTYPVVAGANLWVDPAHRKSNLGMLLPEAMRAASPSGVAVAGAVSRMAQPVYEFLGFAKFEMPRHAIPLRARRHFGWIVGAAVAVYRTLLGRLAAWKTRGLTFEAVDPEDGETIRAVADLIATDWHDYCEVHDAAWLKRHLHEAFAGARPLDMTVVKKDGKMVGFAMTKVRRRETLRNLRDVWHGMVVEWQVADPFVGLTGWLLVRVALGLRRQTDIVEIATDDAKVFGLLRRLGWRRVDYETYMVGVAETSPLAGNVEMMKAENWRLRPAMADNGLS